MHTNLFLLSDDNIPLPSPNICYKTKNPVPPDSMTELAKIGQTQDQTDLLASIGDTSTLLCDDK